MLVEKDKPFQQPIYSVISRYLLSKFLSSSFGSTASWLCWNGLKSRICHHRLLPWEALPRHPLGTRIVHCPLGTRTQYWQDSRCPYLLGSCQKGKENDTLSSLGFFRNGFCELGSWVTWHTYTTFKIRNNKGAEQRDAWMPAPALPPLCTWLFCAGEAFQGINLGPLHAAHPTPLDPTSGSFKAPEAQTLIHFLFSPHCGPPLPSPGPVPLLSHLGSWFRDPSKSGNSCKIIPCSLN